MDVCVAEEDVQNTVKELVAKYHPDLVPVVDDIAVLMRDKAAKGGDGIYLGKSKKAPAVMAILGTRKWEFIIEIAADQWHRLNNLQRVALLDHHLCACRTEPDDQGGIKRCYIQPPDVSFFKDEVERHGFWRTGHTKPPEDDLIAQLFAEDD